MWRFPEISRKTSATESLFLENSACSFTQEELQHRVPTSADNRIKSHHEKSFRLFFFIVTNQPCFSKNCDNKSSYDVHFVVYLVLFKQLKGYSQSLFTHISNQLSKYDLYQKKLLKNSKSCFNFELTATFFLIYQQLN